MRKIVPFVVVLSVGCKPELWYPPAAQEISESKQKFTPRYARRPGQLERYRASFTQRMKGSTWTEEDVEQVIYDETIGKIREGLFQVAFRRRDLTRTSRGQGRRGVLVEDVPLDRDPDITPNFFVERGSARNYYVVSARGVFAMRKSRDPLNPEQERFLYPFHYIMGESLAFLLPILPKKGQKVGVGDRWVEELPVVVGRNYMRNDFPLKVEHTVDSVMRLNDGPKCVVVSFKFEGLFDSRADEFARRFTDGERSRFHLRTEVTGRGKIFFDPVRGKALWKSLDYEIVREYGREEMLPRGGAEQGVKWQTDKTETTFSFRSRLMTRNEKVVRPRSDWRRGR